jgi:glycine oxidase
VADVLILGAGIIGCAVADTLARRGARVRLIDPRGVGLGATQASAGMLAPFTEGRHDREMQALGVCSLDRYGALIDRLREDGHEVAYSRRGSIDAAFDEPRARQLAGDAKALAADGVAYTFYEDDDARGFAPAVDPRVKAILEIPAHGAVGVADLTAALWKSAEARGARLTVASATRVAHARGAIRVETTCGVMDAPHVVLASGCWAGGVDLDGQAPLPVRPVRGQLLAQRLASPPLGPTVWGPDCYLVPWSDGTVLVGATVEEAGFDEQATVAGVSGLLAAAPALLPELSRATLVGVRVGLRPGTPDDRPVIGRSRRVPGLVYATGHYRNGALLAPVTAEIVGDLIEGREWGPSLDVFSPDRFGEY